MILPSDIFILDYAHSLRFPSNPLAPLENTRSRKPYVAMVDRFRDVSLQMAALVEAKRIEL